MSISSCWLYLACISLPEYAKLVMFDEPIVTPTNIFVSWISPANESVAEYEISYTLSGSTTTKNETEPMIELVGLFPRTTVVFHVRLFDTYGRVGPLTSLTVETSDISKFSYTPAIEQRTFCVF